MDASTVIELNPALSNSSRRLFLRFRLLALGGLTLAMAVAVLLSQ